MDTSSSCNLHVAIVSSPGVGHLIPAVVLGNRLAAHHGVRVVVFQVTTEASPPESKLLKLPLHQLVELVELPPVDISHLVGPTTQVVTQLCLMLRHARPLASSAVAAMDPRPAALVVDHFGTELLSIAAEFGMAKYVYVPSNAWFAALTLYLPVLDQQVEGQYVDQTEPLEIPGCKPVRPEDVVDPMLDRNDQQYDEYVKMGLAMASSDGILINSWEDLDHKTLQALRKNETLKSVIKTPVLLVGPLTRPVEPDGQNIKLMSWLDRQPNESVVFVSFGSGGVLPQAQITELAWGLELSQQRFVWVVRRPTDGRVDDAFFALSDGTDEAPTFLPNGFMGRVQNVGFLVPKWAQQVQILTHPAIGGFLSHCGWNSTLESITNGVPIIAWPLYAEQKMNATFLAEEAGVALRPRAAPVVGRAEIERSVRTLMEGEDGKSLREKVKQLKMSGNEALKVGGSSHNSMCEVLAKIASSKGQ
uniref:Glycosyltransferase n=1 Tax=Mentha piperita TaxID=34256 RepID=A0A8K1YA27_MENPI|nr:glycosyltransferase [Mentha x piperita]